MNRDDNEIGSHARRMKLMRMQGELNKQEDRSRICFYVAVVVIALCCLLGVLA